MASADTDGGGFAAYARNPDTWVLAARRNLAVAKLLMKRHAELGGLPEHDFFESSGCYYAGYFHAGVAFENALKAVLISRDPNIVGADSLNVRKFGGGSGHSLLEPIRSVLGTLEDREGRFLRKLEEFSWAGRYTVPTKAAPLYDQETMSVVRLSTLDEPEMLRVSLNASFTRSRDIEFGLTMRSTGRSGL